MSPYDDYYDEDEDDDNIPKEKVRRDRRKYDTEKKMDGPRIKSVRKSKKAQRGDIKRELKRFY